MQNPSSTPEMRKLFYIFFAVFFSYSFPQLSAQNSGKELLRQKTEDQLKDILEKSPALTGLTAIDLTIGERISWNPDVQFPQASAIKIPILMEIFKQANDGKFSLSDSRQISSENLVGGTGILKHLENQGAMNIKNLGILMIALSDNSATNSLIDLVGISEVNKTLDELGMEHTIVQRKMINSAASARGDENLSTPAEAAEILQLLYNGEFIDKATSQEIISILKKTNREDSRIAAGVPADLPVAFKPGMLNGVSVEWTIVFLPERPYAIAAMESYKIQGEAEEVMEDLSRLLYQYYWRLGNASKYGTYVDPKLKPKDSE